MDPTAALRVWREGSREDSAEAFRNLKAWIRSGGFLPRGLTPGEKTKLGIGGGRGLRATKVRINRQGYDSRGQYWGTGASLYHVTSADGHIGTHVRANSAKEAKSAIGNRGAYYFNPRRHFPMTSRGRPKKDRSWTLEYYASDGRKLGSRKTSADKASAYKDAKQMVGRKYKDVTISKVILDGPK